MFFFPVGTGAGSGAFLLFFLMPLLLPMIMRLLTAFAGGFEHSHPHAGRHFAPHAMAPAASAPIRPADAAKLYAAAKAEFPSKLIDLDNELTLAEEFGTDTNATELAAARTQMAQAFAAYSRHFGADAPTAGLDVVGGRRAVEQHLKLAKRHMLLADPNTAAQVAEQDAADALAAQRAAEAEAGRQAAAAQQATAAQARNQQFAAGWAGLPGMAVANHGPRTTVRLTPFGLMITSA